MDNNLVVLGKDIDAVVSTMLAQKETGITKALVTANLISILRQKLTPELMSSVMELQGSGLGFKTDKDKVKNSRGEWVKGQGYPIEIVTDVFIEASALGLVPAGNQFNIIGGNMYPTREGFTHLLSKINGLKYRITYKDFKHFVNEKVAQLTAVIEFTINDKTETLIEQFRVKADQYASYDSVQGKTERKAKRTLFNYITGNNLSDGDANELGGSSTIDAESEDVTEIENKKLESLKILFENKKEKIPEKEVPKIQRILDNQESTSYDRVYTYLNNL